MAYKKLVERIAAEIESEFKEISSRYNFDLGDEFEIALCKLLDKILPEMYGICRGFVVTQDDDFAGDDIIIYDKHKFPTLRLLGENEFSKKQEIPIEAVYAYIEAKHSLILQEPNNDQSLQKAILQVHNFKKLHRAHRSLTKIDTNIDFKNFIKPVQVEDRPDYFNPLYGCIISRQVRNKGNTPPLTSEDSEEIEKNLHIALGQISNDMIHPDMIVVGQSEIVLPGIISPSIFSFNSPFYMENKSSLISTKTKISALAIGIINLLRALDAIRLYKMPWAEILKAQLDLPFETLLFNEDKRAPYFKPADESN